MDYSLPGSSIHGIFQARILQWVASALLQEIFPTQGLNPDLLQWRQIPYCLSHLGNLEWLQIILKCLFFFFFNFTLFYFTILYWFCHTSTWICHGCTRVPNPEAPSHLPPHTITLGHPGALAASILYPALNLDWRFISCMILYMFQCHSPKSPTFSLSLRVQKTVLYICISFAVSHTCCYMAKPIRYCKIK